MKDKVSYVILRLEENATVFSGLLSKDNVMDVKWKPSRDQWCLLEIMCHLRDEEKEDFRVRVKSVLNDPSTPLPPFDPSVWVESRKYIEQEFDQVLDDFLEERKKSIAWLKTKVGEDWTLYLDHQHFGQLSAFRFLSNWLGHDYLHIRQITRLKRWFLQNLSDHDLDYAGKW